MKEIFVDIKDYEWLYQVSNLGRVKSLKWWRRGNWEVIIMSPNRHKWWYSMVTLCNNWKIKYTIHRLVAQAFLWLDIDNKDMLVCHKDETLINGLLDNSVDNLFLGDQKLNLQDMSKKWRWPNQWNFWKDNHNSIHINQFDRDWNFIKTHIWVREAWRYVWIHHTWISACCKWKQKTAAGFIWKYN